jgi:hypothetical protein
MKQILPVFVSISSPNLATNTAATLLFATDQASENLASFWRPRAHRVDAAGSGPGDTITRVVSAHLGAVGLAFIAVE